MKKPTAKERERIERGYPLPTFGKKRYLHDIYVLIELESIITEMNIKVHEFRKKKVKPELIEEAEARIKRLEAVSEGFASIYTQVNFYGQKCLKLEKDLLEAYDKIIELNKEVEKLTKTINYE